MNANMKCKATDMNVEIANDSTLYENQISRNMIIIEMTTINLFSMETNIGIISVAVASVVQT